MRIESAQSMARIDYQHASEQQRVVRPAAQPVPQARPPQSNAKQEESEWESDRLDNRTRLIKLMIEAMLGHEIEIPDPIDRDKIPSQPLQENSDPAQVVDVTDLRLDQETLQVLTRASIQTQEGETFDISLAFALDWRELSVEQRRTTLGKLKDPLVLTLDGKIADFSTAKFEFDLDGDGQNEKLPGLAGASGFLALDRNGNGTVDDGSELLGAQSGNGFAELAALDEDGNQWLDERDKGLSQLLWWQPERTPIALVTLGIGAIQLTPLDTPFQRLGDEKGVLRQSGIYLMESGEGGWVQQVDLRV
ncbi:hypothetical protein [Aeromonas schubertii]|uniref:hypothetical protein n=1 Tax=Aeromonas schubertii TaxID=652 RepID=UPI0010A817EA|nr:hypothetical protein [Aeromonas schubertii]QCG49725.1 hypothetical protein E2P79_19535 [Aeromonas schubertii]